MHGVRPVELTVSEHCGAAIHRYESAGFTSGAGRVRYNHASVTPRTRTTVAVLCIALVLVAGMLPAVSAALGSVVLIALWVITPAVVVTVVRRVASGSEEQPVCLLALLDSRGPPRLPVLL
jgi:hypothetical protein